MSAESTKVIGGLGAGGGWRAQSSLFDIIIA